MRHIRLATVGILAFTIVVFGGAAVFALTATTTISSQISAVISLFTTNGTVNVNVTPTGSGAQTIATDTVTISTNDSAGYTLSLATSGATTGLVSGGNTVSASTGTQTTPIAQANNSWGYAVQGVGGFNGTGYATASSAAVSGTLKFAGVPASGSPNTLATTSGTATNATTTVYYAVAANTSQPTGTYAQTVTYTATAN